MVRRNNNFLFNAIAPIYGLFYSRQKKRYREVVNGVAAELDLTIFESVLDVGCGTGLHYYNAGVQRQSITCMFPAHQILGIAWWQL